MTGRALRDAYAAAPQDSAPVREQIYETGTGNYTRRVRIYEQGSHRYIDGGWLDRGDMADDLLAINDLSVVFDSDEGCLAAVSGVNLIVREGQTVGIVGESGCGKSVTCLSILGLLPPNGRVHRGEILFRGQDLLRFDERRMEAILVAGTSP